jgi:hypothetical protein
LRVEEASDTHARQSHYCIEPNKHYSFHVPDEEGPAKIFGTLHVDTKERKVFFYEYTDRELQDGSLVTKDYDKWEDYMSEKGYVLTPLVQRGGACMVVNSRGENGELSEPKLGCLVRNPETNTLFHHPTLHYQALVDADNTVLDVFFLDALHSLVPVGTIMYLRMEVIDDDRFTQRPRDGKFLVTRLNVPNASEPVEGKIYVTALFKRNRTRAQEAFSVAVTFPVNPWDVIHKDLFPQGNQKNIVKHLD